MPIIDDNFGYYSSTGAAAKQQHSTRARSSTTGSTGDTYGNELISGFFSEHCSRKLVATCHFLFSGLRSQDSGLRTHAGATRRPRGG
jgi:hypothetical protein